MSQRRLLSDEHGHPSAWMPVPVELFDGDEAAYAMYKRREQAVVKYANNVSYEEIRASTGVCKQEVIRFVKLCTQDFVGSIRGFFALVPYARAKQYERTEPSTGGGKETAGRMEVERGFSGCLGKLFRDHPSIREHVHARLTGERKSRIPEARPAIRSIWAEVLELAKAVGVSNSEWPFRTRSRGRSAVYAYCRRFIEENARETDLARHGEAVASRRQHDPTMPTTLPAVRPLSCLQLDYAKVDGASIFEIQAPDGTKKLVPVRRWYWGMLYCQNLKAIVGFHVSLSRNPSADDAMDVLSSHTDGVNEGGLFCRLEGDSSGPIILNGFFPELMGHGMSMIRVDNGWANTANDTLRSMLRIYGCAVNLGRVASWIDLTPPSTPLVS